MSFRGVLLASTLPLWLLAPGVGLAATTTSTADAGAAASTVSEVVVTVRRVEENIERVPVSATAVSADTIQKQSLTTLSDVQDVTPNVFFTDSGGFKGTSAIFIRGVGEATEIFTADPAVGTYTDGIPMTRPQGTDVGLFDVQRVEVLRGPQGTTYGKNTIGGAINFVSREPGGTFGADLAVRYGNDDYVNVQGAVNLPLSSTLAMRLSANYNYRNGFQLNLFNNTRDDNLNNGSFRGMLKWDPTAKLDLLLVGSYYAADETNEQAQLLSYNPASVLVSLFNAKTLADYGVGAFTGAILNSPFRGYWTSGASAGPGFPSLLANDPERGAYQLQESPDGARERIWNVYGIVRYDLSDHVSLKSLTSYRETLNNDWNDAFGTAEPTSANVLEEDSTEFSQELQLIGANLVGGRLNFVSGLYYGDSRTHEIGTQWFEPELMATIFNLSTSRDENQTTNTYAAYGNLNYALAAKLKLTLGFRYTDDQKSFHRHEFASFPTGTNVGFGPALLPQRPLANGVPVVFDFEKSWGAWSGTAALQYQWTPDVMTYVSWSRGFRSGGFSGTGRDLLSVQPYAPEFVDDYELGLRSTLFGQRLVLNATLYLMDYTNRQLGAVFVTGSGVNFVSDFITFNAGSSEQKGVELEMHARPTDWLDLNADYGLIDARYTKLLGALVSGDTVQQDLALKLPNTPDNTATIDARLHSQLWSTPGEFSLDVNWVFRGRTFFDVANSENIAQGGFGLWNARLAWSLPSQKLEIAVWGRNLADTRYRTYGVNIAGNFAAAEYGDPRTFGVEVRKSF